MHCALCIILSSCQTHIDYKGTVAEQQMVVFAQAAADDTLACSVAHSRFFLTDTLLQKQGKELLLNDAVVTWQINDSEWQQNTDGSLVTHAGDLVRLHVAHPDYPQAEAQQRVPYKARLQARLDKETDMAYEVKLRFDDYKGSYDDVFVLQAYIGHVDNGDTVLNAVRIGSDDELFRPLNYADDGIISIFTNRREQLFLPTDISGSEVSLFVYRPERSADTTAVAGLLIDCLTITADYMLHYQTMQNRSSVMGSVIGFGTEEQVQIYSNLSSGIGMFVATNDTLLFIPKRNN